MSKGSGKGSREDGGQKVATEPSGKRVTLKDVAKRAGVSVGMASRVLGGYGSFSEKTKSAVIKAAQDLSYRPNALARSLRMGRTHAIGLVVTNILSFHWTNFIRAIEAAAAERGYQVLLGTTDNDPGAERTYLHALHDRFVDGVILCPSRDNDEVIQTMLAGGLPMVMVETDNDALAAPRVNLGNRDGGRQAVEYLLSLGHRRIGIVTGSPNMSSARFRLEGYREAHAAAGLEVDEALISNGNYEAEAAYNATGRLLSLAERPTAVVVCNEVMAGGALRYLKEQDVSLPDELSLVTFDDPAWMSFYRPAMTTVRAPLGSLAIHALETLLARIDRPGENGAAPSEQILPMELVVRESAVPPRGVR